MRLTLNNIKLHIDRDSDSDLIKAAGRMLGISAADISDPVLLKKSIDARKKDDIRYICTLECEVKGGERLIADTRNRNVSPANRVVYTIPERTYNGTPVVIGAGPAGLFCSYVMVLAGLKPVIIERGLPVESRIEAVESFWRDGILLPDSNVQFGEGGAGAFSDGKLNTLVKDRQGRCRFVLETLVKFGAPANILYDAKPHVGTDILVSVVRNMRKFLSERGCVIHFDTLMEDIEIRDGRVCGVRCRDLEADTDRLILACGHSSRDTFHMLNDRNLAMEAKPFAVGLRIEHPREYIDTAQYGERSHSMLPAASYKLTAQTSDKRGVYTFCMCPGGYVVNASSESGYLAVNGMSYSGRSGRNSNSAVIVTVTPDDYPGNDVLAGVRFQRDLERRAYELGNGSIPYQRYGDYVSKFKSTIAGTDLAQTAVSGISFGDSFGPEHKGSGYETDLSGLLPERLGLGLIEGITDFGRHIEGFNSKNAILSGVESRTSSPVRMPRDNTGQSVNLRGLYPCGEGAGYAGGITSAAMDGMYIAEQVICS